MSENRARLYEEDFVRWSEQQAAALREAAGVGTNLTLDWENLAEEIDSLGRSQRRELRSRIAVIIEHLLKLGSSSATDPRRGWMDTVARERSDIELLLSDSPSLKGGIPGMVSEEKERVVRYALGARQRHGETTPDAVANMANTDYTEGQVLGDWFPPDPVAPDDRRTGD